MGDSDTIYISENLIFQDWIAWTHIERNFGSFVLVLFNSHDIALFEVYMMLLLFQVAWVTRNPNAQIVLIL